MATTMLTQRPVAGPQRRMVGMGTGGPEMFLLLSEISHLSVFEQDPSPLGMRRGVLIKPNLKNKVHQGVLRGSYKITVI